MSIVIRDAVEADEDAIRSVARAAYQQYVPLMNREPAPMVADFGALIRDHAVWVMAGAEVLGFIVLYLRPPELFIENVAVDPVHQGRGFGRQLLDFAEDYARDHGLSRLSLYTNEVMTANLALYPALGYREVGRRQEDGFNRVFFEKDL
ncbi:GNAT family N-acetyltransferase [Rhodobacteraceae bacterium NNCM2]|nr:GNAT family N-acetyltransferase [Coraliihabitans acroporae]